MDQNFSLMAQSRANYYTAGSPVQFVRVELLKGDTTGEVAVCLTFKNVGTEPLTGLVVHFKCKDAAGQVLCGRRMTSIMSSSTPSPAPCSAAMTLFMSATRRFPAWRSSRIARSSMAAASTCAITSVFA